jgi:23S rRNA (guanine2445-N2)-methyltransferase / 23S rRNA (guanine2069-N7)-methyltransferase
VNATRDNSGDGGSGACAPLRLLAVCAAGLEGVVARELADLGYDAKGAGTGRVAFAGDWRAVVDANLWLRAADRVLLVVGEWPVGAGDPGFDALFEGVRRIPWERFIHQDAAFPVSGRSVRSALSSVPALQRATKRAIVERLREAYGLGASATLREVGPAVEVEVALRNDVATLTIDTSGVGLHKRGYRAGAVGEASMKETLAAGLVLLSVWRPGRALVDPFCGAGTIAIEAAMIGRSIAPGLRRSFAAEAWWRPGATVNGEATPRLVSTDLWAEAREEARGAIVPDRLDPVIHASDVDEAALRLARANARDAGVERDIHFTRRDFAELASAREYGVVITNPPYGVRLGDEAEIDRLHRLMPVVFRGLPTWSFHVFTGRLDLEAIFGQPASKRRKLFNSTIECAYFTFLGPRPPEGGWGQAESRSDGADGSAEAEPEVEGEAENVDAESVEPAERAGPAPTARVEPERRAGPAFGGLSERARRELEDFGRCLTKNLRHLRKYPSRGVTCYRVYERDVPDVPVIVDRYEDCYHVAEYERPHDRSAAQQADWRDGVRAAIASAAGVDIEAVFFKEKHRQKGLTQHERVGEDRDTRVVNEGGLKFEVNLSDYIDTGLFLDHRLTRAMVREQASGKRVLNLFCYTGSFTVYAAAGGAASTVSVDLSNTYLAWAERNLRLNGLWGDGRRHALVRADAMAFLREHPPVSAGGAAGAYDLVVVDPPTFSNSKSTREDWEVAVDHAEVFARLGPLVAPGGVVYFSTNFRRFKLDESAATAAGFAVREISAQTVPPEYRNRRIHRCWRLLRGGPAERV